MAGQTAPEVQGYVLRALAASEIAESCPEPRIRRSFETLAGRWLAEAERAGAAARAREPAAPPGPYLTAGAQPR
jgi:hypothetical protein